MDGRAWMPQKRWRAHADISTSCLLAPAPPTLQPQQVTVPFTARICTRFEDTFVSKRATLHQIFCLTAGCSQTSPLNATALALRRCTMPSSPATPQHKLIDRPRRFDLPELFPKNPY